MLGDYWHNYCKRSYSNFTINMKKILNKWQFVFQYGQDYRHYDNYGRVLSFGIIKFHEFPEEGMESHSKINFKGFWWEFRLRVPITFKKR